MKLYSEEDVLNTFLNRLQAKFKLHTDNRLSVIPGKNLLQTSQKEVYQQALTDSLKILTSQYHQHISTQRGYEQLNDETLYLIIYQETDNHQRIRLLFPFGANFGIICAAALVDEPKHMNNVKKDFERLIEQTIDDLVLHEFNKYYQPSQLKDSQMTQKYTDSIRYQSLKNDSFNLVIKFKVPRKMLYEPLRKAIEQDSASHKQTDTEDYNSLALTPLESLSYDKDSDDVQLITSLYWSTFLFIQSQSHTKKSNSWKKVPLCLISAISLFREKFMFTYRQHLVIKTSLLTP